ncbi:MAG: hypothetical protein J5906_01175 [Acidaminococcaceae bacterium]|nr:hypothetical protein [Acidaminococcaceae bacterium]
MKHLIADKLNFLMKATATRNNMLSRALAFDASHISRIRNGERGLPSHREFILPAAGFFARAVRTASQKKVLAAQICPGKPWPESLEDATLLLAAWLGEGRQINHEELNHYLGKTDPDGIPANGTGASAEAYVTNYYPGNEGKRQCVIRFLTDLVMADEPVTLLLHSEERMEWIYENPEFAKQWGMLLIKLLQRGSRIVIVHTINRSFEEMVEAVSKWAPLYAAGAIEPYYTSRLRDNVFQRTLFIAKGKSAILAHSTGNPGVNRLNILTTDPVAVNALEQEFNDFLAMCQPLMQIFTPSSFLKIIPVLGTFRKAKDALMQLHITPSLITLPDAVAESLSARPGCQDFSEYLANHKKWLFMRGKAPAGDITDIIYLPEISTVLKGKVPVPLSVLFGLPPLFYTAEEYLAVLTGALQWMKSSKSYQAVVVPPGAIDPVSGRPLSPTYSIVSSSAGVLLFSTQSQSVMFYTREQFLTNSFWEYLNQLTKSAASREESEKRLQQYINKLKRAIKTKNGR